MATTLPSILGEATSRLSDLAFYPLPTVRVADFYKLLLAAKSEYVDRYQTSGQTPPYGPRDVDDKLPEMLKNKDFVLLAGRSKAGKTRESARL
jgi:hypothetical protein